MTASLRPDLMDPALIADPYTGYGRLREQAPVLLGRAMDGSPAWYVTRQDDVRAVLGDPRFVNNATSVPGVEVDSLRDNLVDMVGVPRELAHYITDSILDADGEDHTRLRKLVSRAFTVRRVGALRPRVEVITCRLLDALTDPVDLVERFAYPLPITVISELVGVPETDRPEWREWGATLVAMNKADVPGAVRDMVEHTKALIARRRAAPTDDLISGLIQVQDEDGDRLTDDEMVTMVLTLVMAGHETTAHLISNATVALLTHPDQLELLLADPSLWPTAVHELMRWCGPVHIARMRYATEDLEIAGVPIRRGDSVQAVLVSANRDPRVYLDPEQLDVTRRPTGRGEGHVGFGHGPHYCLGAALARQEAEVALRALFERFPNIALDGEPQWMQAPGMRRLAELRVRLG
jgi:cytochrome P450